MSLCALVGKSPDELQAAYNRKTKREYKIFQTPGIQVQPSNSRILHVKADNIESLLQVGGVLMNGQEYGGVEDQALAGKLKDAYTSFEAKEGKALAAFHGKDNLNYDGYAAVDMPETTYAAHIEVNGKKILAINKNNNAWLNDPAKRLEVLGHEMTHHWNKNEASTDKDNHNGFVNLYDQAVGMEKELYGTVVNNISSRLHHVHNTYAPAWGSSAY